MVKALGECEGHVSSMGKASQGTERCVLVPVGTRKGLSQGLSEGW